MTTATEMRRRYSAELEGDWSVFAKIAGYFEYKVKPEDREDFHHDLLVEMTKVKAKYEAKGKPLTEASLMVVADYELKGYWIKRRKRLFGLNCPTCTKDQRRDCHAILPSECPKGKARHLLNLDNPVKNNNEDKLTKLEDLIADKKSIDLDGRLNARRILQHLPKRLVKIGYKLYSGEPISEGDKGYIINWRKTHPRLKEYLESYPPFDFRRTHLDKRRDHLDERILELLRKNPKGLARADLSMRLQVFVRDLQSYLDVLLEQRFIISVKRESTRGRPPTPLLFIAGATIPEEKNVATERDECIRQAYFIEGWSIKRIKRELHHDKRTIHRAIYGIKIKGR